MPADNSCTVWRVSLHLWAHSVSLLRRYMVIYSSAAIEQPLSRRSGKGFPLGEAGKKGTSEPFLTEEGTEVRFFRLVSNFQCSTLYPPFGVLSPKGKAWVLPHQCVNRYLPVCICSNESSGPYGVKIPAAIRHEKAEGPAFKLQFSRRGKYRKKHPNPIGLGHSYYI